MSRTILTESIANDFVADPESVDLSAFTSVDDGALKVLAALPADHGDGLLDLSGLQDLSAAQLDLLRTTPMSLRCDGVHDLSVDMALALSRFTYGAVGFLSVSSISSDALQHLAQYGGPALHLGLESLAEGQAEILAGSRASTLSLPGLESLAEDDAEALLAFGGQLRLRMKLFPINVRRILRQHASMAGWGEVETHAEPVCKLCGERGRIFIYSDMTPYQVLRAGDRDAAGGWTWNICPDCSEGMTDEEIDEMIDSDA